MRKHPIARNMNLFFGVFRILLQVWHKTVCRNSNWAFSKIKSGNLELKRFFFISYLLSCWCVRFLNKRKRIISIIAGQSFIFAQNAQAINACAQLQYIFWLIFVYSHFFSIFFCRFSQHKTLYAYTIHIFVCVLTWTWKVCSCFHARKKQKVTRNAANYKSKLCYYM